MHPKNKTRYKSLNKIAADPRVDDVLGIWDEGKDGLWISLANGYENALDNSTCLHEWSVRDLQESFRGESQDSIGLRKRLEQGR